MHHAKSANKKLSCILQKQPLMLAKEYAHVLSYRVMELTRNVCSCLFFTNSLLTTNVFLVKVATNTI